VTQYKLGCLPGYIPNGLRDLTFYCPGKLPQAAPSVTVPVPAVQPDGTAWGMDGNDQYGNCGAAGFNHGMMADDIVLNYPETIPSRDQIIQYYLSYTGGQDTGVVLADFLAYIQKNQFFGHTVEAYAPVGVHDIPTLQFAVDTFDFSYTGITVYDDMMTAFQNGEPWDVSQMNSAVDGGHCVPLVGYDSQYLYCITWGAVQKITYPGWHYISTEAWAVISGDFVAKGGDGRGVDIAALKTDLPELRN
jgi:hypothetical protein